VTRTHPCEHVDLTFIESAPFRTTRTVTMRGNIVGDEAFLAWEPFTHMAFRFNQSTSNAISAFAEDYRVVETPSGCHLTRVKADERFSTAPPTPNA
jgi:hypothetical protein